MFPSDLGHCVIMFGYRCVLQLHDNSYLVAWSSFLFLRLGLDKGILVSEMGEHNEI